MVLQDGSTWVAVIGIPLSARGNAAVVVHGAKADRYRIFGGNKQYASQS